MSAQCTAVHPFFGPCAQTGTPRVAMCVHEHLRDGALCDLHADVFDDEGALCKVCANLPTDAHECELSFATPAAAS